jgi:hypothetical protein
MLNRTADASFMIRPSRPLFDRLLAGKAIAGKDWRNPKPRREARFEEVGWKQHR